MHHLKLYAEATLNLQSRDVNSLRDIINAMTVALVITTFNWPSALNLVLFSVANQTRIPDEVIIADDGSSVETQLIIERWAVRIPIIHTWLPNVEFRAARARNLALLKAESDYLVMIDGDCLLPPTFIEYHLRLAGSDRVVAGSRFLIGVKATAQILKAANSPSIPASLFQSSKFRHLPLGWLRDAQPFAWQVVRTCNLALPKEAVTLVSGFDESYVGWGREDSDFVVRLLRLGFSVRSGRFAVCVGHLHHEENGRESAEKNDSLFRETVKLGVAAQSRVTSVLREL